MTKIAKDVNRNPTTVRTFLARFRRNGCNPDEFFKKRGRSPKAPPPKEIVDYVTSRECLKEWARYSIKDRRKLIEQRFGERISIGTIYRLFREHSLRWLKPELHSYNEYKKGEALVRQRKEFAIRLG